MTVRGPYLLDHAKLKKADERKALVLTGELAAFFMEERTVPDRFVLEKAPSCLYPGYARELALLPSAMRQSLLKRWPGLARIPLAGPDTPDLVALGDKVVAMALYPMTGQGEDADCGLRLLVEGESQCLNIGPDHTGTSWGLADALCSRVLGKPGDVHTRVALAKDWIVTGRVLPGEKVGFVTFKNKGRVDCGTRIWLVPAANGGDARGLRSYRLAASVDDAVAHVTGEGTTEGEELKFPATPKLHALCGGQIESVILSIILGKPSEVLLWHSKQSFSIKSKTFLAAMSKELGCEMETREMPSDSLALAERKLREHLQSELTTGNPVYFNITSGNLLMRMAVFQIARQFPNLRLIYKNADLKTEPIYDCIRFPGSQALTQIYKGEKRDPRIDWSHIFETDPNKKPRELQEYKAYIFTNRP